ncbi:MAG: cytochrome c peroxidase [Parvicella sp.]
MDDRDNRSGRAVSLGDDGVSLSARNTPTLTYAAFSPVFHINGEDAWIGGQFMDGRAKGLVEQARGPILNATEMAMRSVDQVANRIRAVPIYKASLTALFPTVDLTQGESLFEAISLSIAAFEQTVLFSTFNSKYDRSLRGEIKLTKQEELGRTLFFSQQFTNCSSCHQLQPLPTSKKETFSNYEYHNIGTPSNRVLLRLGKEMDQDLLDVGLLGNPDITSLVNKGKFKVPTLRNIAVTAPYMHNGVFNDLSTVLAFYNKYNSKNEKRQINPETNERWVKPEVPENISLELLQQGPALDHKKLAALEAFLETLTDQRYEHLIHSFRN